MDPCNNDAKRQANRRAVSKLLHVNVFGLLFDPAVLTSTLCQAAGARFHVFCYYWDERDGDQQASCACHNEVVA
eukprot:5215441-Amphidinium_carterae.1